MISGTKDAHTINYCNQSRGELTMEKENEESNEM